VGARLLAEEGCRVVAVSDSHGGVYNPKGLDMGSVTQHKAEAGKVSDYRPGDAVTNAELLELPCDILVPAAMESQITEKNAVKVQAKAIIEGANGPTTPEADPILRQRGIMVVPDILANAGGVMVSYFEWVQDTQSLFWEEAEVNRRMEKGLVRAFNDVYALSQREETEMRTAAYMLGVQRVAEAITTRGIYP